MDFDFNSIVSPDAVAAPPIDDPVEAPRPGARGRAAAQAQQPDPPAAPPPIIPEREAQESSQPQGKPSLHGATIAICKMSVSTFLYKQFNFLETFFVFSGYSTRSVIMLLCYYYGCM